MIKKNAHVAPFVFSHSNDFSVKNVIKSQICPIGGTVTWKLFRDSDLCSIFVEVCPWVLHEDKV